MKSAYILLIFLLTAVSIQVSAQTDSVAVKSNTAPKYTQRDSIYAAKLNYTGNLMIGGGIGLAGAGTFLLYEGINTYKTPAAPSSTDPAGDVARNHRQGTGYIAAGTIAFIGSAVLTALGARNKIAFKQRKKMMTLQSGLLDNGNLGAMLTF